MFKNTAELADFSPVKRDSVVLRREFALFGQKLGFEKKKEYILIFSGSKSIV